MATVVNFQGKNYIEPGAYAATTYTPSSVTNFAEFGNVLLIDFGLSKNGNYEFAGGSGISGQLASGLKSVYAFDDPQDFWDFMGGGLLGDVAQKIFKPATAVAGAPKVYYVRAAKTTPATLTLGGVTFTCKNEGIVGNGVKNTAGKLAVGYAGEIVAGDTEGTFKVRLYRGNFEGVDDAGEAFGNYLKDAADANLLAESDDIKTQAELYEWARSTCNILTHFQITKGADTKLAATASLQLASGGKTDYNDTKLIDDVLEAVQELDLSFILTTDGGANGLSAHNEKIYEYMKTVAQWIEVLFIPGYKADNDIFGEDNSSQAIAKHFDSEQVVCVHGAPEVTRRDGNGTKQLDPIYLTADIIGLAAGAAPQTPLTFRRVGYRSFAYSLKRKEREKALQAGILHVRNVNGNFVVNQGVTTLQDNKKTIADDSQSLELSIVLIKSQLNKELMKDAQNRFVGGNAYTASPEDIKNFTETKLQSLTCSSVNGDNLIVSWQNVSVKRNNTDYKVTYDFAPNMPVNKIFFIGNMLDLTL